MPMPPRPSSRSSSYSPKFRGMVRPAGPTCSKRRNNSRRSCSSLAHSGADAAARCTAAACSASGSPSTSRSMRSTRESGVGSGLDVVTGTKDSRGNGGSTDRRAGGPDPGRRRRRSKTGREPPRLAFGVWLRRYPRMPVSSWMSWEGGVDLVAATSPGSPLPNLIVHVARMVHTPVGSAPSGMVLWQPDPKGPPAVRRLRQQRCEARRLVRAARVRRHPVREGAGAGGTHRHADLR
jgi:hypothetical protein